LRRENWRNPAKNLENQRTQVTIRAEPGIELKMTGGCCNGMVAWFRVFMKKERVKDLLLRVHVVVRTSNVKTSRRSFADNVKLRLKTIYQKRAAGAARLFSLIQPIIA